MRLETRDLAFGYPERRIGSGVNLSAGAGEVLCLLGPNGCGKTTLFKTLLGLSPAQGGSIALDGEELASLPRTEIARRMAYVPQAQTGLFPFTALDLVLMGRSAHRGLFSGPTREDRELARQALDDVGIASLADRDVTRLSGGQRQLVIVARALAQSAPLVVMDEPTASLDFGNQAVVLSAVATLARRGVGIILSTHDPDHAFAVATRVSLMRDGEVTADGPPHEVLTAERLEATYDVAVTVERLATGQTVCAPRLDGR